MYCTLQHMAQVNLHTTPEFEEDLAALIKGRGLRSKSEAIRLAVREAAAAYKPVPKHDLSALIGFVDRLPGGRQDSRSSEELLAEIDDEMEAKLERLARRR
jgi:Arc/MetJ-type ribon-helix-helix transcriptional regulator